MMNRAHERIYAVIAMILGMATFLADPAVEARTYYVATSGDDNHSGAEAEPLRTIQKAAGQDNSSLIADPLFVGPEKDDFRLRPRSPAVEIGFEPWDLTVVGPRPGHDEE